MKALIRPTVLLIILISQSFGDAKAQSLPIPTKVYTVDQSIENEMISGEYRVLELNGRKGINPTSVHTRIMFSEHILNQEKGSFTYWVFPLEELSAFKKRSVMFNDENLNSWTFSLLSDMQDIGNYDQSSFNLAFYTGWHPSMIAKFHKGDVFIDAISEPKKAYAMASAFEMHRNKWYQMSLTWDMPRKKINLYTNGVLIATADEHTPTFERNITGDTLYSGKPLLSFGDLKMYDEVLNQSQIEALFEAESLVIDNELQASLKHVHRGEELNSFNWQPDSSWNLTYDLSLTEPNTLDKFYVQGVVDTVDVSPEGLRIRTLNIPYIPKHLSDQMYLWTRDTFEGDIFVEYEFRTNQKFGLALLVLQAAGMAREDIMKDYLPRISGSMQWIHSSDMRNYHIEFYRVMNAVRNDNSNAAMIKNPYEYPLGYGTFDEVLEVGKWYMFQILQQGNKFTCAINDKIVFEAIDKEFSNNGPILTYGHLAFRCMVNTDMNFRNLKVFNKELPYKTMTPTND